MLDSTFHNYFCNYYYFYKIKFIILIIIILILLAFLIYFIVFSNNSFTTISEEFKFLQDSGCQLGIHGPLSDQYGFKICITVFGGSIASEILAR